MPDLHLRRRAQPGAARPADLAWTDRGPRRYSGTAGRRSRGAVRGRSSVESGRASRRLRARSRTGGTVSVTGQQLVDTSDRERAIVDFSIELTLNPDHVNASSIQKLKDAGLQNSEILDLIHSIAIFAWANRLMLNLGEPIFPSV